MAVGEARVPMLHERSAPSAHEGRTLSGGETVATSLVAGAVAGALAKTTIAPLDRAKIVFQTSRARYSWQAACTWLRDTAARDGGRALWRGNSATVARIAPYAAIQFAAHEHWKRLLGVDTPAAASRNRFRHAAAGSLAGVTSQSATYPLDVARARMAVGCEGGRGGLGDVLAHMLREGGVRALYRGYFATILGVIPYAGVSFFTYDNLKQIYYERYKGSHNPAVHMCMGGVAGALAQSASYPLDILRRRMQTAARHRTLAHTARHVYSTEGLRGFFKGLSMNWVKGPIAVGISFATYDAIKTSLRDALLSLDR